MFSEMKHEKFHWKNHKKKLFLLIEVEHILDWSWIKKKWKDKNK